MYLLYSLIKVQCLSAKGGNTMLVDLCAYFPSDLNLVYTDLVILFLLNFARIRSLSDARIRPSVLPLSLNKSSLRLVAETGQLACHLCYAVRYYVWFNKKMLIDFIHLSALFFTSEHFFFH